MLQKRTTLNLEKHDKVKPIDERMRDKYVRIEHKNLDKPQSNIKFKITQKYPDYNKALTTLKEKFITNMKIYLRQDLTIGFAQVSTLIMPSKKKILMQELEPLILEVKLKINI